MIAVEEFLQPIPGDNPSGADLRYDPVYDTIREARREDEELPQGTVWQIERKTADIPKVISLASDVLKKRSKDLQIAIWLMDAWLRKESFGGLAGGLQLAQGLLERFWDTLYPAVEEGDDLEIDLAASVIRHGGKDYGFPQFPESVRKILELGGLAAYLKTQLS